MPESLAQPGRQRLLVAQVWLLSRGAMALVAVTLMLTQRLTLTQVLSRWDVLHFTGIAADGYTDPTSPAFFPGLPLLLKAGSFVGLPVLATGVLVALVSSALAAAALYRLGGAPAACLWLLAPTAVFTVVGYSEAPFCAAAFWAWQRAKDDRFGQAAALAAVACAFRVSGLFLVAGLGVLALVRAGWGPRLLRLAWLLIPVAVLGGYEIFLHQVTGSWRAWLDAEQAGWARGFTSPWAALQDTLAAGHLASWPGRPDVAWVFRAEVVSMAVGLATTVWALWRRHWAEAFFVGVQVVAFGTSWWYMSVNRAVLLWWPLWLALGAAVAWRPRDQRRGRVWTVAVAVGVAMEVASMLIWAWLFFTGRWAS